MERLQTKGCSQTVKIEKGTGQKRANNTIKFIWANSNKRANAQKFNTLMMKVYEKRLGNQCKVLIK